MEIIPTKLQGSITPPPSKSLAHRAVIAASLAPGVSKIYNINMSQDIIATVGAVKAMGSKVEHDLENGTLIIDGKQMFSQREFLIDCNESGSTARFFIPLSVARKSKARLIGVGQLGKRPMSPFYPAFIKDGIKYENRSGDGFEFLAEGELLGGEYELSGDVSSQFLTGLIFALSTLEIDSKINITTKMESRGYVDLTLDVLKTFGIKIVNRDYKSFFIAGSQKYKSLDYTVESDFSQAAFFLSLGAIGNEITTKNMNIGSSQGDKRIIENLEKLGYLISSSKEGMKVLKGSPRGAIIDGSECPDIIPVLAVVGALTEGKTIIKNSARLRIKECDRIKAMYKNLKILGANIKEKEDGFEIIGVENFTGGDVDSFDDHRIAMSMAVASTRCKEKMNLKNPRCVGKSYPHFWEDFMSLGGKISG